MGTREHPDAQRHPYFVTFTTRERRAVFQDAWAARLFVDELHKLRHELSFLLLAYVVMPDHVHVIIVPGSTVGLSKIMQYVKGRFARLYHARMGGEGHLWQSRYYETIIRDEGSLVRRIHYLEGNPVRTGLVRQPEEYPFSSATGGRIDLEQCLSPKAVDMAQPGQAKAGPSERRFRKKVQREGSEGRIVARPG